jgi:hypothetical protein
LSGKVLHVASGFSRKILHAIDLRDVGMVQRRQPCASRSKRDSRSGSDAKLSGRINALILIWMIVALASAVVLLDWWGRRKDRRTHDGTP